MHSRLVVLGGGPGGYAAAFLAADEGLEVTLVEADPRLGRHLPAAGLHSVEGPAARGPRDRRSRRAAARLGRRVSASPRSTSTRSASAQGEGHRDAVRRPEAAGQAAQCEGDSRPRRVRELARRSSSKGTTPRFPPRRTLTFDHCILATGSHSRDAAGVQHWLRPRDGFDRRAGPGRRARRRCWSSAAATSAWKWARSMPSSARRSASSN